MNALHPFPLPSGERGRVRGNLDLTFGIYAWPFQDDRLKMEIY